MPPILVFEDDATVLASQPAFIDAGLTLAIVDRNGSLRCGKRCTTIDLAAPDAAWAGSALYRSGMLARFVELVRDGPSVQFVQSVAAGYDRPELRALQRRRIPWCTGSHNSSAIAEYVLAEVLDHFQHGPARRLAQAERRWAPAPFREVAASNWAIVGMGGIGQEIAKRARAFDARILGINSDGRPHALVDRTMTLEALRAAPVGFDVIVLCAPLNPSTRHLVDAAFLAGLSPHTVLVNVGRGALVDEAAMRAALDGDQLSFAILDVFDREPLPADSWLWCHPKVRATAHTAYFGEGGNRRAVDQLIDNVMRLRMGYPLRGAVSSTCLGIV